MSLWERVSGQAGFERIKSLYNENFPLEVRILCAAWIEERIKAEQYIDINDPQYEQRAANFISNLIQQLELEKQRLKKPEELSIKYRIEDAMRTFTQNIYSPGQLYKQIRDALMYEQHILDSCANNPQLNYVDNEVLEINDKIKNLRTLIMHNNEAGNRYKHELEQCMLRYSESTKRIQEMSNMPKTQDNEDRCAAFMEECKRQVCLMSDNINQRRIEIYSSIRTVIDLLDEVQKIVIHKRLGKWQRDQALAGNGAPLPLNALDEIQIWFEDLAELIWNTRTLIDTMRKSHMPLSQANFDGFEVAYREITNLLQNLIVSGFIVEKQPPQVMKTNTRFAATVRLLLANVSIHLNNPFVTVSILSEAQAQAQQQNHSSPLAEASGEILNNTGNLELQQATRHLTCNLRNMQLKKIKRAEKKGTESVMDEKFALLFQSKFQTGDMQLNVWVMSLPVVVIVHGNQEPQSWATITWDNAFSEVSRIPFTVVDRVPWSRMASALNMKFYSQTGRSLTNENLYYLCEKAYRATINFNPEERPITWSQFCKEALPDRTFTFWDWFYAVMKLTRDQLRGPWTEGLIIGFINKRQAEEMLLKCPPGTFLLRFSDSELGGITIAWVEHTVDQLPQIVMLQPFCHKDFAIRSLGDRIKDLNQCVYLYPDIPKDKAFGNYYTPLGVESSTNGYVKPILKTTVPDECKQLSSYPNTPQHNWQSPDDHRDTASVTSFNPHESDGFNNTTDPYLEMQMDDADFNALSDYVN
ncbi:signal transducer and activator of transcription 5B-like isoform X1 [Sitodiplosis mosellana]|uniref:signal transducer and activator of transcription 5B-like isoform X1 n=1 Tax=Sitodiplosis mosellana TaxID=263140 RepID=UPI002443BF43|nr:signal transducer and activator of transcription 5B-like isoform X1 [Sitodiplosis mosellana]XP_055323871.1 signal transducer and activator of transcription 5B-like isoform X1 [Sitodiplosis mosellana]XP_055323872.1 signal transducer and activator of transcription 5B-like isoform X1 [Sitodiplosis mosellana]XP_055323873.1 signal transducer and activator of transcription 5B-like isoform X1 [Sitodiplosis mosellana]